MDERLEELSSRCSDTYTVDDILEHLEEECLELLLAIKRVTRKKEPFINFLEELFDTTIEINTILTALNKIGIDEDSDMVKDLCNKKLDKFEAMLDRDKRLAGEPKKARYHSFESVAKL